MIYMSFMPAFIVGVFSILVAGVTFLFQRYTQAKYHVKEKQKLIKEKQKLISVIYKTKDPKDPKVTEEINALQKEVMSMSMGMMKTSFKNMLWVMLLSLLVFAYISTFMNSAFPVGSFLGISSVFVWYIIVSICANILYKVFFSLLEKKGVISDNYGQNK